MPTLLLASSVMAAGTWLAGWWTVPIVAAGWAWLGRPRLHLVALAGALAWSGLLAWRAGTAPVGVLAGRVAPIFGLPPWGLILVTPLFAALLAGSAAALIHKEH